MPRTARIAPGGMVFHVLNRGVARMQIFRDDKDYDAFRRVVEQTLRIAPVRICAYCWMPNHWHFVLWPQGDGDLSKFMQRMANMHTQRWQRAKLARRLRALVSRAVQVVSHRERRAFLSRGALRRAECLAGRTCSAPRIGNGEVCSSVPRAARGPLLAEWPLPEPSDWIEQVNSPQTEAELEAIRRCLHRGSPYGNTTWAEQAAEQLGLQSTLRSRGRPHKSRP